MPLLNGEAFCRKQPPDDLDPEEKVFMSPVTLEVFRDYDEYFERTILVNSATWQCGVCGRGPFTFVDATSCEESDRRELDAYNSSLAAAILYVIQKSKRRRLSELVELLCSLVSTRFFIGEPVSYSLANTNDQSDGIISQVVWASMGGKSGNPTKNPEPGDTPQADDSLSDDRFAQFDSADFLYHVNAQASAAASTEIQSTSELILPFAKLKRKEKNAISRDRIRYLIRLTCELKDGCFVPKASMMRQYDIHPHGHLQWKDLFVLPEPDWEHLSKLQPPPAPLCGSQSFIRAPVPNRPLAPAPARFSNNQRLRPLSANNLHSYRVIDTYQDGRMGVISEHSVSWPRKRWRPILPAPSLHRQPLSPNHIRKLHLGDPIKQGFTDTSGRIVVGQPPSFLPTILTDIVAPATTLPPELSERYDRVQLEHEWCLVKRREDLELPDLVPLPEFPEFTSRIPSEDLGAAFQLFEFYHVFGEALGLFIPRGPSQPPNTPLSWHVLESALVDQDPSGPLADFFISMLCAIRRFEANTTNKVITPSMVAATHAAASAVAAAEFGYNTSYFFVGHASDYSTLYEELATGPAGGEFYRVLRDAAAATRLNELVGIPCPATSNAAGKAAVVATMNEDSGEAVHKYEPSALSSGRDFNARAATTATLAGATALCPLDRSGLTKALWIHFCSAAAKIGAWRSQIWGGARPLDDPVVLFARDHSQLLAKLDSVSVFELSAHEKLLLLTCLMDQLLLYPQFRDRYDESFDRQRSLKAQLRAIRTERAQTVQPGAGNTANGTGTTQVKSQPPDVPSSDVGVSHTKSNQSARVGRVPATGRLPLRRDQSEMPNDDTSCITTDQGAAPDDHNTLGGAYSHFRGSKDWVADERKLCEAICETCRGSSMLSLGQDRFGRRYWLLLSFPCVLIEDAPLSDPSTPRPFVAHRQISSFHPDLAACMGLNSVLEAGLRLRNTFAQFSEHEAMDRYAIAHRTASKLPRRPDGLPLTYDQLCMLVNPERPHLNEITQQNSSPAVLQAQRLLSRRLSRPNQTVWHIIKAFSIPYPTVTDNGNESTRAFCEHPTHTSHVSSPLDVPDKSIETSACTNSAILSSLLGGASSSAGTSLVSCSPVGADSHSQATWVVDCLEASLNPRGTRECRLRKTIGQLRPVLIDVITSHFSCDISSEQDSRTKTTSPESTLLTWLEISLRRLASRLRMSDHLRPLLLSSTVDKMEDLNIPSPSETCNPVQSESPKQLSSHQPPHARLKSHLRRLANALLSLGLALGPNSTAGPTSDENKTLRGTGLTQPSGIEDDAALETLPAAKSDASSTRTTGWQRWCSHVESASSPSELHLLARALERGLRRAALGGRGVPSTVRQWASKHPLPKIRCTACKMPPDPSTLHPQSNSAITTHLQYTPYTGAYVPLSTCAGCFAPFHLDCLMNSRSRVPQRPSLRHPPRPSQQNPALTADADLRMTGCCGFLSPLCSVTAARMETICGSLYLCNACLRAAGRVPIHCAHPREADTNSLTGEEDWDTASDAATDKAEDVGALDEIETKQEASESNVETLLAPSLRPKRSRLMCPRRFQDGDEVSVKLPSMGSQAPCSGSGSNHSGKSSSSLHSRHRSHTGGGRSRARVRDRTRLITLSPFKGSSRIRRGWKLKGRSHCRDPSSSGSRNLRHADAVKLRSSHTKVNKIDMLPTPTVPRSSDTLDVKSECGKCSAMPDKRSDAIRTCGGHFENGQSSDWEDDALNFPDITCLKKASVILAPCDIVDGTFDNVHCESGRPSEHAGREITEPISALSRASAERLFGDLCGLSFARPLLRCGLGRSATMAELDSENSPSYDQSSSLSELSAQRPLRRSSRRRSACCPSTHSDQLYAWDLAGLQELLLQGNLPGGPHQALEQLRLLLTHWKQVNRPGSRLHRCATDLSIELDKKLRELSHSSTEEALPARRPRRKTSTVRS